jgi:LacI family transcriptional regulator
MGIDGIAAAALTAPGLTTIEKPRYAIGAEAASLAVEHVLGRQAPRHLVLPCRLVERASVAPRRTAPAMVRRESA